jgi:TonB family protein
MMYHPQLENIKVAAPCTAEWRWMYGNDRVRFCNQCKLNVYNLSALTREQAEDLIRNTEGRLCVRFYRRKDGTIITQNCPQGLAAVKQRFRRAGAGIAAALLTFFGSIGILGFTRRSHTTGQIAIDNRLPPGNFETGIAKVKNPASPLQLAVKRSEAFMRERAIFQVSPTGHSATTVQPAGAKVVVEITISPAGEVIIAESTHRNTRLQDLALEAARRWKFQPVTVDGAPATVKSQLTFHFAR